MTNYPNLDPADVWGQQLISAITERIAGSRRLSLPFISQRWYDSPVSNSFGTVATVDGSVFFSPFWVPQTTVIDGLSFEVATAVATANCWAGVYSSSNTGVPLSLLGNTGPFSASTVGVKTATGLSISCDPAGVYWLAFLTVGGAPTVRSLSATTPMFPGSALLGHTAAGDVTTNTMGYNLTGQTALPASVVGATANGSNRARVQFRVA